MTVWIILTIPVSPTQVKPFGIMTAVVENAPIAQPSTTKNRSTAVLCKLSPCFLSPGILSFNSVSFFFTIDSSPFSLTYHLKCLS